MRIVHVVRQFHPIVGGLELFVESLVKEQRALGIDATVVTLNRVKTAPRSLLPASETVHGVPVRRIGFAGSFRYPLAPGILPEIHDADIVHVHAVDFFCDYLAATRWLHRKPMVLTTHGGFFHTPFALPLKRLVFGLLTPLSMRAYDLVCACSRSDHALFSKVAGNRLKLMQNGVDTHKFAGAASTRLAPSFLFIGRFASNKSIDRLIDTMAAVVRRRPDARLHIVGTDWDGMQAGFEAQFAALRCGDNISIHLDCSDAEIRHIMGSCSFFITASSYEGFALTTIECMAAGLVPIVSPLDCFKEVIDATGIGTILSFADAEAAADRIIAYLGEVEAQYPGIRHAAMARSKSYDCAAAAQRMVDEYRRLLPVAAQLTATECT